jgi:hypothetical protein
LEPTYKALKVVSKAHLVKYGKEQAVIREK